MGQLEFGRALKGLIKSPPEAKASGEPEPHDKGEAAMPRLRQRAAAGQGAAADPAASESRIKAEPRVAGPGPRIVFGTGRSAGSDCAAAGPDGRGRVAENGEGTRHGGVSAGGTVPDGAGPRNVDKIDGEVAADPIAELARDEDDEQEVDSLYCAEKDDIEEEEGEIEDGNGDSDTERCSHGDAAPAGSLASIQIRRRRARSSLHSPERDGGKAPRPKLKSLASGGGDADARNTAADTPLPESMLSYWESLKGGRRYPSTGDLDPNKIAEQWPSSLVLNLGVGSRQAQVERSFSMKLRAARDSQNPDQERDVEYTPMMVEWILSLGRLVSEVNGPVEDSEAFPTRNGDVRYHIIALPLSDEEDKVDRALCHIAYN